MVFSFLRRPKADTTIDIGDQPLIPGDEVVARVNLISKKGFDVRIGTVKFECVETYWKNEYNAATKSTQLTEKTNQLYEFQAMIMKDVSVRSNIPVLEEARFWLPTTAHRTVVGKTVKIAWRVKVSLDVPGAKDLHAEEDLIVVPGQSEETVERQDEVLPVTTQDSFGDCGLRIELPTSRYELGDTVQGVIRLEPLEDCSFSELRVELVRDEKAGDKKSSDTLGSTVLGTDISFRAGLSQEWRFDFPIPNDPAPTVHFSNSALSWKIRAVLPRSFRRDYSLEPEIVVR